MSIELEDEIRDGFCVSSKIKKVWKVQLDLAKKLVEVCNKYNLKCYIIWGTLLGAVRHKGFIPWDDDFDMAMPRKDYNILCSIADKEFQGDYFFQNALSDRAYFIGYSRLRNSSTTGIIKDNTNLNYNNGIYIDIYPMDGLCKNIVYRKLQFLMRDIYTWLSISYYGHASASTVLRQIGLKIVGRIARFTTYEHLYLRYTYWCSRYNEYSDKIGLIYHPTLYKKYIFNKKDSEKIIYLTFEDTTLPAPEGFRDILSNVYGNYMEFPPVEERGKWHEDQIIYEPDIPYVRYLHDVNVEEKI